MEARGVDHAKEILSRNIQKKAKLTFNAVGNV